MPINITSLSLGSSATGEKVANLISNIRRNAVRYEVIKNHRFEDILLTEPTICSQCHEIVYLFPTPFGKRCKLCKLTSHQKCLGHVHSSCIKNSKSVNTQNNINHEFKPKFFRTPTYCKHCGVMIKGFTSKQGLMCSANNCKMTIHYDCLELVCHPCDQLPHKKTCFNIRNIFQKEISINSQDVDPWKGSRKICIEDFDITGFLGTGSFSKVYLGKLKQSQNNEEFAIKVIKKTNPIVSSDPESVFTEMRALSFGRQHPFLTMVHYCFQSEDRLFFVMERVVGRDLVYHITKETKFSEDRARFYLAEIVLALIFLHSKQLIYRDLRLDNIILDKYGHCKLLDFGMSKELTQQQTTTRTFCGHPNYISPEVIRELDYSFSVDWWALGIVMFEMLCGYSPFYADDDEQTYCKIVKDQVQFPKFLSGQVISMLTGLLDKDPDKRLGCNIMDDGEQAILNHPFFLFENKDKQRIHQWEAIKGQCLKPPYIPTREDIDMLGHDQEDLCMTPVNSKELEKVSQKEFVHFSYCSEYFRTIAKLD